jgi:hypothetical protein
LSSASCAQTPSINFLRIREQLSRLAPRSYRRKVRPVTDVLPLNISQFTTKNKSRALAIHLQFRCKMDTIQGLRSNQAQWKIILFSGSKSSHSGQSRHDKNFLFTLPIVWVTKQIYMTFLSRTSRINNAYILCEAEWIKLFVTRH